MINKKNFIVYNYEQGSKPWRYTGKEENMEREDIKMVVKKWWDVYEDESLDYKNTMPNLKADPLIKALSEAAAVDHMTAPPAA
jgi:inositol 3-alpha-galactosyltransferase